MPDRERLNPEELADRAGLHRTNVGPVEWGERNVSIDNIERLAAAIGLDVADLPQWRGGTRSGAMPAITVSSEGPVLRRHDSLMLSGATSIVATK